MICANPDLVVERGHRLIPCAGALAQLYEELGGDTRIAGKPHKPIYSASLAAAEECRGKFDHARILAIGDGMPTDVRGAISEGLELLYISAGIHARDYMDGETTDEAALDDFLERHQAHPRWWMPRLA
jgi:ribonucleotide monophosphatase NagD (HAD superfamily)